MDDPHDHAVGDDMLKRLEKQIADLKSRWPAHSVPPSMLQELDELEEELDRLKDGEKSLKSGSTESQSGN